MEGSPLEMPSCVDSTLSNSSKLIVPLQSLSIFDDEREKKEKHAADGCFVERVTRDPSTRVEHRARHHDMCQSSHASFPRGSTAYYGHFCYQPMLPRPLDSTTIVSCVRMRGALFLYRGTTRKCSPVGSVHPRAPHLT